MAARQARRERRASGEWRAPKCTCRGEVCSWVQRREETDETESVVEKQVVVAGRQAAPADELSVAARSLLI
jgi:hypothetical protein